MIRSFLQVIIILNKDGQLLSIKTRHPKLIANQVMNMRKERLK